jgi:uncharacterized lipoprotein NlpE involved in copper resistance
MAIITKNRAADATAPTTGDIVEGELAVNFTSKKIYTRNSVNAIIELSPAEATATASAEGIVELATQSEVNSGASGDKVVTAETLAAADAIDAASVDGKSVSILTQSAYDALVTAVTTDANTLYFIVG